MKPIPVVDLFAGPGGLGEGFAAARGPQGERLFKVLLSIEKDQFAHSTLTLRAFFRQFPQGEAPKEYYEVLEGKLTNAQLYSLFPSEAQHADREAWLAELGRTPRDEVRRRVKEALRSADPWVLIGGPPCQAYSIVGRSRRVGVKGYVPEKDHRQTLYREYLQILADHWPAVFVMENVKGLLSARLNGTSIFDRIVSDLQFPSQALGRHSDQGCRYRVYSLAYHGKLLTMEPDDYVVKAEHHGIPQSRHRLILFGVREGPDGAAPQQLPLSAPIPLRQVLVGLPRLRSGLSAPGDSDASWLAELKRVKDRRWLAGIRHKNEAVYRLILDTIDELALPKAGRGRHFVPCKSAVAFEPDWFLDAKLRGVCNHEARLHMSSDLHRYLYAACFASVNGRSPKLGDFPADLLPAHENAGQAAALVNGLFADRFRVQLRDVPATTITSHIHKDGHYYIHYDPSQCRSFTVREAARAQTFPDNYLFCGSRTQQFHQVGNAVPPLLARDIARITWRVLT